MHISNIALILVVAIGREWFRLYKYIHNKFLYCLYTVVLYERIQQCQ